MIILHRQVQLLRLYQQFVRVVPQHWELPEDFQEQEQIGTGTAEPAEVHLKAMEAQ